MSSVRQTSTPTSTIKHRNRKNDCPVGYEKRKGRCPRCTEKHISCFVRPGGGPCLSCTDAHLAHGCEGPSNSLKAQVANLAERLATVETRLDSIRTPQSASFPNSNDVSTALNTPPELFLPPASLEIAPKVEHLFFEVLKKADLISEKLARNIARFFGGHQATQFSEPKDLAVRALDTGDVSSFALDMDRNAIYVLFSWTTATTLAKAVVKVSHDSLNVVICSSSHTGLLGSQTLVEWFSWPDSEPLRDILVAGGRELGLIRNQKKTVWFYKTTQKLSGASESPEGNDRLQEFCGMIATELQENSGRVECYPASLPQDWQTPFACIGEAFHKVL